METNTYTILEEKREDVEKKLKRIAKKAQKYDIPFSYSEGDCYCITKKHKNEYGYIVENHYEVYDLTIESEVVIKDGYTVLAHIEHADNGNIVNTFVGDTQTEWITMKPFCEHCNSNHNLHYTFIVDNGTERKQVGRTCLKDYCGIDPQMIGAFNAFFEELEEDTADGYDFREPIPMVYDATQILGLAIKVTKEQGYIKSDEFQSNKGEIIKHCSEYISEEYLAEAEKMAKDILDLSLEDAVAFCLNNVQARLKGWYCKPSDFGYFAYAPTAYAKMIEKKAREEHRRAEHNAMGEKSEYVGEVGERRTFKIKSAILLTTLYNDYGCTYLQRFIDENDNVLIWFGSSILKDGITLIKATVKAHNERDGVKQTILTRVKEI